RAEHDDVYDAFAHERSERGELPMLAPDAARAYVRAVRQGVLALIDKLDWSTDDPLLTRGFVVGMVLQHELQHQETMTQTLQLGAMPGPLPGRPPEVTLEGEVLVEAGAVPPRAGGAGGGAYGNRTPAHQTPLAPLLKGRA